MDSTVKNDSTILSSVIVCSRGPSLTFKVEVYSDALENRLCLVFLHEKGLVWLLLFKIFSDVCKCKTVHPHS